MKPAWDQLGDEYESSGSVVIGDADCTASGKELCDEFEVRGYPTIKYFSAETGEKGDDYQGGRSFDALKKHVEDNLEAKCLLDATDGCTEKEKEFMTKWLEKPAADIEAQLTRLNGMKGGSMKPELKKWLVQRLSILKQLKEKAARRRRRAAAARRARWDTRTMTRGRANAASPAGGRAEPCARPRCARARGGGTQTDKRRHRVRWIR